MDDNRYWDDLYFKYLLSGNDQDSAKLIDTITYHVLNQHCIDYQILNTDLLPKHDSEKLMIVDFRIINQDGATIIVEMQHSSLTVELVSRFELYLAKAHLELEPGEPYDNILPTYLIVFAKNAQPRLNQLYEEFKMRSKSDREIGGKMSLSVIEMNLINDIVKQKGINHLNNLEYMVYLFVNGMNDDIISVRNEVVTIMKNKQKAFSAEQLERYRQYVIAKNNFEVNALIHEGRVEGRNQGILEGKAKLISTLLHKRFPDMDDSFLYELTENQLDEIAYQNDTITLEELKNYHPK